MAEKGDIHFHIHTGFSQWQQPHLYIIAIAMTDKYFVAFYSDDFFCRHSLVYITVAGNCNYFVFRVAGHKRLYVIEAVAKKNDFFDV